MLILFRRNGGDDRRGGGGFDRYERSDRDRGGFGGGFSRDRGSNSIHYMQKAGDSTTITLQNARAKKLR